MAPVFDRSCPSNSWPRRMIYAEFPMLNLPANDARLAVIFYAQFEPQLIPERVIRWVNDQEKSPKRGFFFWIFQEMRHTQIARPEQFRLIISTMVSVDWVLSLQVDYSADEDADTVEAYVTWFDRHLRFAETDGDTYNPALVWYQVGAQFLRVWRRHSATPPKGTFIHHYFYDPPFSVRPRLQDEALLNQYCELRFYAKEDHDAAMVTVRGMMEREPV